MTERTILLLEQPSTPRSALPDAACPLLGLSTDPSTHFAFPHPAHRCYVTSLPAKIEAMQQAEICLARTAAPCIRLEVLRRQQVVSVSEGETGGETAESATVPTPLRRLRGRPRAVGEDLEVPESAGVGESANPIDVAASQADHLGPRRAVGS